MNAERLLALFERISEAPDAIPRLRRFILDLAVRGKLVEQDPEDEPAGELLREMESRFKRLRITKKQIPLEAKEIPFSLPDRWQWTRLGQICEKTGSGSTPRGGKESYGETGIPFLRSQNVYNDGLRLADVVFIDEQTHQRMAGTRVLPCDLLLNITGGSIGRCAKVPVDFQEANVSQHVAIIRVGMPGMEDFIHALILSPYFQSFVDMSQTGAGRGGLPKNRMDAIPVALPPLAEQHRIVAKVDELMALCDQLEAARQQREQCRERLVAASLQRLNQPSVDPESFRSDAHFALQVLPSLTSSPAQIKQLRQTILSLAVRGKLVEQDPEDESAAIELRIVEELKARQKCKKPKKVSNIEESEQWCTIPERWAWARWGQVSDWITYGFTRPMEHVANGIPIITGKNVNHGQILFDAARLTPLSAFEMLSEKDKPQPGDILITKDGSIGRTAIVAQGHPRFCINQSVAVMWLRSCHFDRRFLQIVLDSPQTQEVLLAKTAGVAIKHISITDLGKMVFPLPPLAEQHRIVAKVDALMALCDQLEQQLSQGEESRRGLLEAVLQEALVGRLPERSEERHAAL